MPQSYSMLKVCGHSAGSRKEHFALWTIGLSQGRAWVEGTMVATSFLVEKIPFSAIQEGLDAFRQILILEQQRARQRVARVAVRQGLRGGLLAVGAIVLAFAIHLGFFWVTVGLYQRGASIGALILGSIVFGLLFAGICAAVGARLTRSASIRSIVRPSYERTGKDRERARARKEAA